MARAGRNWPFFASIRLTMGLLSKHGRAATSRGRRLSVQFVHRLQYKRQHHHDKRRIIPLALAARQHNGLESFLMSPLNFDP